MVKKLIGFRVDEEKCEEFYQLIRESGDTVQSILANFVEACVEARSVEIAPIRRGKGGRELSNELRLRKTIQKLGSFIGRGDFGMAEYEFGDLTSQMRRVHDETLLEAARLLGADYLKWVDEHSRKTPAKGVVTANE